MPLTERGIHRPYANMRRPTDVSAVASLRGAASKYIGPQGPLSAATPRGLWSRSSGWYTDAIVRLRRDTPHGACHQIVTPTVIVIAGRESGNKLVRP